MDRQNYDSQDRASIASCGKNDWNCSRFTVFAKITLTELLKIVFFESNTIELTYKEYLQLHKIATKSLVLYLRCTVWWKILHFIL